MTKLNKIKVLLKGYKDRQKFEGANETVELIVEALEKQVPKKPSYENEYGEEMCPNCNFRLEGLYYTTGYRDTEELIAKYCPSCGQKLDWGGVNDK